MPSSRCSFVLLSIALCLSIQQRESFAFGWTQNLSRKVRKNPSRFQVASVTSTNLNKMRQRPGLEVIRIGASSSSSASIDDGDADNVTQQSPSNWWLKDPRNRSVSGILICTWDRSTLNEFNMFHYVHGTFATHSHWKKFVASFLSLLGFTMVAGPLVSRILSEFGSFCATQLQHSLIPIRLKTPALGKSKFFWLLTSQYCKRMMTLTAQILFLLNRQAL